MNFPNRILSEDRYFSAEPVQRSTALELYRSVSSLPIIAPHGHVDPQLFSDPNYRFGSPTELFILPDHYLLRMLHADGIPMENMGITTLDGTSIETDHRKIWQVFAEKFYLFRGTPSGVWLRESLDLVFGIRQKLNGVTAQGIYDSIQEKLNQPQFTPRALFEKFNIEVLCTTDAAADTLAHHQSIRQSQWQGIVLPTFRPDAVVNLHQVGWKNHLSQLSEVCGFEINSYRRFIHALEERRAYFKTLGAVATDHASETAFTGSLSPTQAQKIFEKALRGEVNAEEAQLFIGHMLIEFARMSVEDGLVMQWHVGSLRNHNPLIFSRFGADKGADIPIQSEFSRSAKPLLDRFGSHPDLRMILFTLDETTYARELAPLAGHYPAIKLGPPWWFHDSMNGMERYFNQVMETAGLYNTAGFNDDTRAFLSIPVRHDLWRRASANWVAGLLVRGLIDDEDAVQMIYDLSIGLVKKAYRLEKDK